MPAHVAPMPRPLARRLQAWLRAQAAVARAPLLGSVLAGAVAGALLIAQAFLLALAVNGVVIGRAGLEGVRPALLGLLGVAVLRMVATLLSDALAVDAGARVVERLRTEIGAHIARLGPAWTRNQRTGEMANTVIDAVESVGRYYTSYLPQMALIALTPVMLLVFIVPADWVSGLIMAVTTPLIPLFMVLIGKGTEALNQTQWRKLARMSGQVFDAIEGLATLKLFGASRAEIEAVAATADAYRQSTMAVLRVAFLSSVALEFVATVSIAMVAVYIGFRLYYGQMRFLPGFAVLLLAPEFYRTLRGMGAHYHARMEAIASAEAIRNILDRPLPVTALSVRAAELEGPVRAVRLEDVGFVRDGASILTGIDLTLARGRCVALVGPSGAGKTTLAELLLRFADPTEGRITADGVPLGAIDIEEWRRRVAWLPQRPTLFHGTILDNIRLGRSDASLDAVRRAAEAAGAADLIARLPHSYDTVVGDRGQGLSGGEIQRIALARVFLKDADLVVLDEPEAALDTGLARIVRRAIAELSRERAVLVVAHSQPTVRQADEIVVLNGGRIVARGRHEGLLAEAGAYASWVNAAEVA